MSAEALLKKAEMLDFIELIDEKEDLSAELIVMAAAMIEGEVFLLACDAEDPETILDLEEPEEDFPEEEIPDDDDEEESSAYLLKLLEEGEGEYCIDLEGEKLYVTTKIAPEVFSKAAGHFRDVTEIELRIEDED